MLFVIFLLSLVSATNIKTNYYIHDNKVLVEHYFESVSNLELKIPYDVNNVEVNGNFIFEENILKIDHGENISIKYITSTMIDKSGKKYYFISKNYFNESQIVKLVFPVSAVLVKEGLIFPEPDLIISDGRSIILNWKNYNEEQILVNYEFLSKNVFVWYILVFIILFIIYFIFQRRISKKKIEKIKNKVEKKKKEIKETKKEIFTKNLFEDEKRIIEYLLNKKNNESWTKEIFKDLGITKVKLSRKLRSLEQKGLIKKIPYGNENRILLIKS